MSMITGSKLAAVGVDVAVEINDEVVSSIASKLARRVVLSHDSVTQFLPVEDIERGFCYSLKVVLSANSGAKPKFDQIPVMFGDLMKPLNCKYRGVRIHVGAIDVGERPNSYPEFCDILDSIGIKMGKPLRVDPDGESNIMKVGVVKLQDVDHLVGIDSQVDLEELVVRAMLDAPQKEQEKLTRILGHMDNVYVDRDELLRQWACSLPVGSRA